jgi:hypothetical protein
VKILKLGLKEVAERVLANPHKTQEESKLSAQMLQKTKKRRQLKQDLGKRLAQMGFSSHQESVWIIACDVGI